jgi:hypothetical protein
LVLPYLQQGLLDMVRGAQPSRAGGHLQTHLQHACSVDMRQCITRVVTPALCNVLHVV